MNKKRTWPTLAEIEDMIKPDQLPWQYYQGKDGPVIQDGGGSPAPIIFKLEDGPVIQPQSDTRLCPCPLCVGMREWLKDYEEHFPGTVPGINTNQKQTKGNSMIIEVAVVSVPTILAQQGGAVEKLILAPTPVVANDERAAIVSAVLANHKNFEKVEPSTLKVIVRGMGN